MKNSPYELIAVAHNADLDMLGAARCLQLLNPQAQLLHPVRLKQNAWEAVRKSEWFKTIKISDVDFKQLKCVHMVGISQSRHNIELVEAIGRHGTETVVYTERQARLPFSFIIKQFHNLSMTAAMMNHLLSERISLDNDDKQLFNLAVCEKTWLGLSSKCREEDFKALAFLRSHNFSSFKTANAINLGFREGQAAAYHLILKSIEDIQPGYWPVSFAAIKTNNAIQDLEPVIDAVWSDISSTSALIMVTYQNFSRIWARSSISQIDFFDVFSEFRPARHRNWIYFNFTGHGHEQNRARLLLHLENNLRPDLTAGDIMSASPRCVSASTTVKQALDEMLKFNIMSLIVIKNDEFAGIITRRDLDRALQMNLLASEIGPWVPTEMPVISPSTPVRVLKNLMIRYNLTRLPVIEQGRVKGIITTHELLRAIPDYLPLPHDFLPLAEKVHMPEPLQIEEILKRVFSLRIFHLLNKISRFAGKLGIAAFAVGGFVRDLLLERQNFDLDVVIIGDAMKFAAEFSKEMNCDFKVFDRFHTARIYLEDLKVDFSSARIEHYSTPGALPQIEYSGLSNDLYRRDFTINALALSLVPESFLQLKDFFGGFNDLINRKIKILHSFSFLEDPTRLFRALRFAGRFNFNLEKDTQRAFELAVSREAIARLSIKRIATEISRCFNEDRPQQIISDIFDAGLMKFLSPELVDASILPGRFKLIRALVKRFRPMPEEIDSEAVYWTGLLSALNIESAEKLLDATGTPHNRRVKILQALISINSIPGQLNHINEDDHQGLYDLLSGLYPESLISTVAFAVDKRNARKILFYVINLRQIKCHISGKDLLAEGIKPGPHIRRIFNHIISLKLNGQPLNREEELKIAAELYQNL